jgi:hypothetical protein
MGCVMYPFDLRQIKTSGFLDYNDCVLFDAPIGSLKVTLSREELAYDDNTKATLTRLVEEYESNFIGQLQNTVDQAQDLLEAVELFEDATENLGVSRVDNLRNVVKWSGLYLGTNVPKRNAKTMLLDEGWSQFDKFEDSAVRCRNVRDAKIVIEHNPSYSYSRFQLAGLIAEKVLWVRCKRAFREQVLADLGNPEIVELDTFKVPAAARVKRGKTVRRRKTLLVLEGGTVSMNQEDVDLAEGGLYIIRQDNRWGRRRGGSDFFRISADRSGISASSLKQAISTAYDLGLVEAGTMIVVQNEDHAALGENWTLFGEDLIPDLQAKIDVSTFTGLHKKSYSDLDTPLKGIFTMQSTTFANAPEDLLAFKAELTTLGNTLKAQSHVETDTDKAHGALAQLGVHVDKPEVACPLNAMTRRYRDLCVKYSLLKLIIEPNPYYSYSSSSRHENRQTEVQLKTYCDLLHAEQQLLRQRAAAARAELGLNDNNQIVEEEADEGLDVLDEAA